MFRLWQHMASVVLGSGGDMQVSYQPAQLATPSQIKPVPLVDFQQPNDFPLPPLPPPPPKDVADIGVKSSDPTREVTDKGDDLADQLRKFADDIKSGKFKLDDPDPGYGVASSPNDCDPGHDAGIHAPPNLYRGDGDLYVTDQMPRLDLNGITQPTIDLTPRPLDPDVQRLLSALGGGVPNISVIVDGRGVSLKRGGEIDEEAVKRLASDLSARGLDDQAVRGLLRKAGEGVTAMQANAKSQTEHTITSINPQIRTPAGEQVFKSKEYDAVLSALQKPVAKDFYDVTVNGGPPYRLQDGGYAGYGNLDQMIGDLLQRGATPDQVREQLKQIASSLQEAAADPLSKVTSNATDDLRVPGLK